MVDNKYTIGEVCEILKCEQHILRYIEKTLNILIQRDDFMNRIYSQDDINKLQMIFELKDQGLNYAAIKKVLDQQQEIVEDKVEETRNDLVIQNQNMEQLIETLTKKITDSIEISVGSKLQGLTNEIEGLKKHNEELQRQLQKNQEEHFAEIDNKLIKLREEMKEVRNRSLLSKLLGKKR